MEQFYYPETIKGVTVAFLDVFNQIIVKKYDKDRNFVKDIKVPIQFGPIEKAHHDRLENHHFDTNNVERGNRFYQSLPRMSVTMDGLAYNADRAYGVNEDRYWKGEELDTNDEIIFQDYQPTPCDINFTLHIKTDSMDYFAQIMENILPFFNPAIQLRVREFSFLNIERDLKMNLNSVNTDFIEDMNNEDTKYCNASLSFTVEAYVYRPWSHASIIKVINSRYFVGDRLETSYSTSGVALDDDNQPTPLSAVPDMSSVITSGSYIDDTKKYNWYKGAINLE